MNKILTFFAVFMMACGFCSCSNTDEPQMPQGLQNREFEIVKIRKPNQLTRASSEEDNSVEFVLNFDDEEAYERTLSYVKSLDEESKRAFFEEIGFDGAYMLITKADEEFDVAFDLAEETDSVSGVNIILDCVDRYTGVLAFNEEDPMDVTPFLPFSDEDAELLGSQNGYVMIAGELIAPESTVGPTYNGSFIKYKAEVTVKNGKYTSYFRLGRIGQNMAFELETYRRIIGFKKSDKNCKYSGDLQIWSNGKAENARLPNDKGAWRLKSFASVYSPRVNMKMTNFSSTRNSNNKVSKTVTNILVK